MHEIPAGRRQALRPLFADAPGLHGCLHAVLEDDFGVALADDREQPRVALLRLDFSFVGGDASGDSGADLLRSLPQPAYIVPTSQAWARLVEATFAEGAAPRERVDFLPGAWDRQRLRAFQGLPRGYEMARVDASLVGAFRALAPTFVEHFRSNAAFLARGVGFGVLRGGEFVAGCSSFTLSGGLLEFEIQTHPDHRRRGLALAAAARMIDHCLDTGLEPCWDAANEPSALLAAKLGFVEKNRYLAYYVA